MEKSRHGWLKQRLAGILLRSSCTNTSTTSPATAAFVTNQAPAPAPASCCEPRRPSGGAGPWCSHEPRPKIDRRRGRPVRIEYDDYCVLAGASSRRSALPPVVARAEKSRSGSRRRGGNNGDHKPHSPPPSTHRRRYSGASSSSLTGDDEEERCDPGAETTLFSSLSLSSDSTTTTSDYFYTASTTRRRLNKKQQQQYRRKQSRAAAAVDGVNGGVAVVKRSYNPYADFKRSMVEMVAERRIRGADGMGELLVPYLSLNSPRHHPAILAAFEAVFLDLPAPRRSP